jgi:membrane fusion protein (multidrug efflux system)
VRLLLEDGSTYARPGRLLFADLSVDSTTGQITLRAEVPNPGGQLLPGLYVRVQLEQAKASDAILLPQQAVSRSPQGDTVMVVGSDGKVTPRPVKIGAQQAGQWVILDGLKAGDNVMVDGVQKLRGGAPVKPVPWQPPGTSGRVASTAAPAASGTASGPSR